MKPKLIALLMPACLALWAGSAAAAQRFIPADVTQHFLLNPAGGVISVEANAEDPMAPDEIHTQLSQMARSGVPELKLYQAQINYLYTPTAEGGRVQIDTTNSEALIAIHAYLRSQIQELRTGDSEEVK